MVVYIGQTVRLLQEVDYCPLIKGELYHVQDTNFLACSAKIGKLDTDDMVWENWWVEYKYLESIE